MSTNEMNTSSNATQLPPPLVLWAQRKDKLFVNLEVGDCLDPKIEVNDTSLYFRGKSSGNSQEYEVKLEFHKEVDASKTLQKLGGREVTFVLVKKDPNQGYWPRLLQNKQKPHFLKIDFNKWKDEDDESAGEETEDFNLDQMMQSMGGLQGAGDLEDHPGQETDSDDEDLPDLEK